MKLLPADRPWLIAEAGVNHNGRLDLALRLVDAAARAGADAVKFQTFRAEALASSSAPQAAYQRRSGRSSQLEMLKRLELSPEAHRKVRARCRARGVEFLSTPFDEASADFLDALGVRAFKIASPDAANPRLLAHVARKRKPVFLSTGMCTLAEVRDAVRTLKAGGARGIAVLHCVSSYPTPPDQANLRAIPTLARALKLPVGYSDHTTGLEASFAAAALGARVIEKHFTLDKSLPGPDHAMSLDPGELARLASGLRLVAAELGDGIKRPQPCEADVVRVARRSLVFARDMAAGERIGDGDLAVKRPGTGLPPKAWDRTVGRRLRRAARADELVTPGHLR